MSIRLPLVALLSFGFAALQQTPAAAASATRDFPAASVRGFGTVSGSQSDSTIDGKAGSVLTITCENEDYAKMVLAKFLSDEQCLPGVTKQSVTAGQWGVSSLRFGGTPVTAWQVEGQGWLSAVRVGAKVLIATAPDAAALVQQLDGAMKGAVGKPVSEAEVKVPMWLDRWDQHGFRFYYSPWATPPNVDKDAYDFRGDSTFAKDHHVGMVFWDNLSHVLGADGQTDRTFWDWDEKWAAQDDVPTAINLSTLNYDIPVWVSNRYRDGMMLTMPDFLGDSMSVASFRGTAGKTGELAFGDTPALNAMLRAMQADVRHFNTHPNVVSWLEPHGELAQGGDDLMGYGPACDRTFRAYLKQHYKSEDEVSTAWTGKPGAFASWDAVTVPEIADFCGWGPDALDLAGTWHISPFTGTPSPDWLTPAFNDSAWLAVTAPGDDRNFSLPKTPSVYRRSFDLPADWTAKHPKSWIYLWDCNMQHTDPAEAIYLNGKKAGESAVSPPNIHWMTAEVTSLLQPGTNQLSLVIPDGFIGYRVYLTGTEPKQYPGLGVGLNQKWVDLVGWRQWVRVESVRRGMEMIREVDPNRGITLMAPGYAADGVKSLAQEYGGEFHDTGFMAGVWADLLPTLMRGSDLPFSVEPGGPANDAAGFKRMMGLYASEGVNEVSYFIHIGDVMWHPEIRKAFEEELPMIHLIGKYHEDSADVAFLWSTEVGALSGFPWSNDRNTNLPSGWSWRGPFEGMLGYCQRDAISESDFKNGYAAKYKVIIDTNTSIMDQAMIDQIKKYVSDGGTFVTMIHTGRHSPTQVDSWPIEQLTGYHVLTIEKYNDQGGGLRFPDMNAPGAGSNTQQVYLAPGQNIFKQRDNWMFTPYVTGLRMKKVKDDAQDLLTFADGTVAVGMRKIGRGQIIEFGAKSDSGGGTAVGWYRPILEWLHVKTNRVAVDVAGKPDAHNLGDYFCREYESNNGLYNVTTLWNPGAAPLKLSVLFHDKPSSARDVDTQEKLPLADGKLDLTLDPNQLRMILTPRNELTQAAGNWFDLQRKWWRASKAVTEPFPKPDEQFVRPLDDDWAWQAMTDKQEPDAAPGFDDSKWPRISLGAWTTDPARKDVHHAEMRRTFTVPAEWNAGTVRLWVATAGYPSFSDEGRVFLDGKPLNGMGAESGVSGSDVGGALTPESKHTLTVEARGKGQLVGLIGDAWIIYIPKPVTTIDLAGAWTTCKDDLFHDTGTVTLPGPYESHSLWRTINVPQADAGKTVMLVEDAERPFVAIVNGTQVQYSDIPSSSSHVELNITPFIHFGQDNRIQLISVYNKGTIGRLGLDFYEPGTYP
jgi:hypothetical protein